MVLTRLGVVRFAYQLDAGRQLTGDELSGLAGRMVSTAKPARDQSVIEWNQRVEYPRGRG